MFVFGGNATKASFNDLWEFHTREAVWKLVRTAGHAPSGRVGHTLTALGSRLLVLGGREYATNHFDPCLHSFNVRTKHWSEVPLLTPASIDERSGQLVREKVPVRTGHCASVHAGALLLFGGLDDQNHFLDDVSTVHLIG